MLAGKVENYSEPLQVKRAENSGSTRVADHGDPQPLVSTPQITVLQNRYSYINDRSTEVISRVLLTQMKQDSWKQKVYLTASSGLKLQNC